MSSLRERFRWIAWLFTGWSVPGWVIIMIWLITFILDWSERIAAIKAYVAIAAPALIPAVDFMASRIGQLTTLTIGLGFIFISTWRKFENAPVITEQGLQKLQERRKRAESNYLHPPPELRIEADPSIKGCWTLNVVTGNLRTKYLHAAVSLNVGQVTNCKAYLTRISKDGIEDFNGQEQLTFSPSEASDSLGKTIHHGVTSFLDVLAITVKDNEIYLCNEKRNWLRWPRLRDIFAEHAKYLLTIALTGDGVSTLTKDFVFDWTGNWQTSFLFSEERLTQSLIKTFQERASEDEKHEWPPLTGEAVNDWAQVLEPYHIRSIRIFYGHEVAATRLFRSLQKLGSLLGARVINGHGSLEDATAIQVGANKGPQFGPVVVELFKRYQYPAELAPWGSTDYGVAAELQLWIPDKAATQSS